MKMNADEDYGFDVSGYLHVPQGLTPYEVAACNEAIDEVEAPQWLNELTPAQQAVLGVPGQQVWEVRVLLEWRRFNQVGRQLWLECSRRYASFPTTTSERADPHSETSHRTQP